MCNDEKLLKYQLKNKRKAKYEMGNFCEQYGLPPIAPSRQKGKKHDKIHKNYNHKKYKKYRTNFVKPNDFYAKRKNVSKKYDKQNQVKVNVLTVVNLDSTVKIVNKNLVS